MPQQDSPDIYLVKTVTWKDADVRIITQNENGPCPLVAICNVLFLRGDLVINPPDREMVSFEYLVERLGDYLLTHEPSDSQSPSTSPKLTKQPTSEMVLTYRHNLDGAFTILPSLKKGLDVNVKFDNIRGFESTAELAMFDLFDVDLVHGWVADPQDAATYDVVVKQCGSYNHAVECIVQGDELSTSLENQSLSSQDEEKIHKGFMANEFLKDTATQLTYYGLDLLLDSIPNDSLCVLFRNNHFSTIYRHPDSGLYMLVTDSGLVNERSIAWESLNDVDQGTSEFYNGKFEKPKMEEPSQPPNGSSNDLDLAIAMSLQDMNIQQEPSVKSRPTSKYGVQQQLQPKTEQKQSPVVKVPQSQSQDLKKKKSCIIS